MGFMSFNENCSRRKPEEYEKTYRELIERTKSAVRKMVLVTPYYLEPNREDPMRVRMVEYADIVRRLARENLDQAVLLGVQLSIQEMLERNRIVHPNTLGAEKSLLKGLEA